MIVKTVLSVRQWAFYSKGLLNDAQQWEFYADLKSTSSEVIENLNEFRFHWDLHFWIQIRVNLYPHNASKKSKRENGISAVCGQRHSFIIYMNGHT